MKEALMTTWRQLQDKWRLSCATREFAVRAQTDAVEVWLYEQIGEDIFRRRHQRENVRTRMARAT
ncbi:MAG: hypothetical protein KatS3mg038_2405 [Candidatus Kapaibacterium sp.]|nr:MAG: hypothetical protein KatS3mg038_2405 [Candidatus Kapabacteria bacterium]